MHCLWLMVCWHGPHVSLAQGLFRLCAFEMDWYYVAALGAKISRCGST